MVQAGGRSVQAEAIIVKSFFSYEGGLVGTGPSVAGVVVLYRPGAEVPGNVSSYLDQVEVLYAVDNTEAPDASFVRSMKEMPGVRYLPNKANLGVAAALNIGARRAIVDGAEWLLTMDQDSVATPDMVATMLDCATGLGAGKVGLVSPFHVQVGGIVRRPAGRCVPVLTPMTSGSLVDLAAYEDVGPFLEELFIDQVDKEFCLRLQAAGYSVIEAGAAELSHRVGEVRFHRFPVRMYTSNHTAARRYYMTRNRFHVGEMYRDRFPAFRRAEMREVAKDAIKIVLHERQKGLKLRMMLRGYRDYLRGHLGPMPSGRE